MLQITVFFTMVSNIMLVCNKRELPTYLKNTPTLKLIKITITIITTKRIYVLGPSLFLPKHLNCLSHCHWTMLVDNVILKIRLSRTSNSMVTLPFFPWCNPKWSEDKFNMQSQVLQGLGMTSWSIM